MIPLKRSVNSSSSSVVISKRQRTESDTRNLWLDIPDDILVHVIRFITMHDPEELFGLEASCKSIHQSVSYCWKTLAKDVYAVQADDVPGKELWNEGRALASLQPDRSRYVYFRNADFDVFREGVFFGCNKSIMVMSSSDHNIQTPHGGGFIPACPIRIRDAKTLKILANMDGSHHHKAVDVMGPSGNEIIIEYLDSCLKGYRNCQVVWEHEWKDPEPTDVWCLLPSEKAILIVRNQSLHIFSLDPSTGLPCLTDTVVLEHRVVSPTFNWLKHSCSFCMHVRPGVLSFWNIQDGKAKKYRTMTLAVNKCFNFIYAGSKHLVTAGAQDDDAIHVFDTEGNLLHRLVEGDLERPTPGHVWSPMNCAVINGGLLVSNSLMGAALCVWNLRTGQMVQRFEQSIAEGHMFRPGNNYADGTWVHCLDVLPSFDFPFFLMSDNDGSLFAWAFPSSPKDFQQLQKVQYQAARENL